MSDRRRGPAATGDDAYATWLGMRSTGVGEVRLDVRAELVNPLGKVYGPVGFALVDYAMGDAVWDALATDRGAATINIAINYLTSADHGELVCRGRVDRLGRSVAFTSAEVRDAGDRLLMTAVGTFGVFSI